jgi:hypothetical protein
MNNILNPIPSNNLITKHNKNLNNDHKIWVQYIKTIFSNNYNLLMKVMSL